MQEEQAADQHATNWLLGGLEPDDPQLRNRALGIAVAVLCLQSPEVTSDACLRNTHPAAHDRIYANTSRHQCDNEEVVKAMCTVLLQYLFVESGITANVDGATFSEICGDLLYDIARSKHRI